MNKNLHYYIDLNCFIRTSYEVWQAELDLIHKHLNFLIFKTPYWLNTYYLVYPYPRQSNFRDIQKMQESDENLQVEDKEYLRKQNVDLLTDAVVNKIFEKDVDRILNLVYNRQFR